ncbi:hypothetical protein GDO86_007930 [Hymenochirus boettgeri]|uniref:Uncharacterized protein n=1 Tax=Hymenochirus boettgeri TaxID=247094 RepID=A0A8T2J133_9PIPI|nr:hypothetical protein GDO86_007930 [Hymenochirus boettgeri]KAG8437030.1 hypothetical protein GDO86_007930 [Hymenochirus boettgeri]
MGRDIAALVEIFCLVMCAGTPGKAKEQVTIQTPDPVTASPVNLSSVSPSIGDFKFVQDETQSPNLIEHVDSTAQPQNNGSITTEENESLSDVVFSSENRKSASTVAYNSEDPVISTASEEPAFSSGGEGRMKLISEFPSPSSQESQPAETVRTEEITVDAQDKLSGKPYLARTQGLSALNPQYSTDTTEQDATATSHFQTNWMATVNTTSILMTRVSTSQTINSVTTSGPADLKNAFRSTNPVTSPRPTNSTITSHFFVHTTRSDLQRGASVLNVGDEKKDVPMYSKNISNPIFVMMVSIFTIMAVMVVVVIGFQRYRRKNSRTEFRRLQDLPMDDMMEDTPLSLYSY